MVETIEYRGLGVGDHLGLTFKAHKHEMPDLFWYVLHEGRYKREIKTLKFVSASTKGFKGGLAWIKPSKKDMAVTFSYSLQRARSSPLDEGWGCLRSCPCSCCRAGG